MSDAKTRDGAEPVPDAVDDPLAPSSDPPQLHPAENRGYRELNAAGRQLIERWTRLIAALAGNEIVEPLEHGIAEVRTLLDQVEERTIEFGLSGKPAAQAAGAGIASARGALIDRSVDTGMVVRLAVLDIEHIATLLPHLAHLAEARGDERLAKFDRRWAKRIRVEVKAVRGAAVRLGADPDLAASPIDDALTTRAAHGAGWLIGTLGEAWDRLHADRRTGD